MPKPTQRSAWAIPRDVAEHRGDGGIRRHSHDHAQLEAEGTFTLVMIREDDVWNWTSSIIGGRGDSGRGDGSRGHRRRVRVPVRSEALEDGNVAFSFTNEGEEEHELVVVRVTEDFDIESVLEEEGGGDEEGEEPTEGEEGEDPEEGGDELPPGVEEEIAFTFASPEDQRTPSLRESSGRPLHDAVLRSRVRTARRTRRSACTRSSRSNKRALSELERPGVEAGPLFRVDNAGIPYRISRQGHRLPTTNGGNRKEPI